MKIAVVGAGYVGLSMAVLLSQNVTIKKNYWHSLKRTLRNM